MNEIDTYILLQEDLERIKITNLMKVKLTKLEELVDALHPNNIPVGHVETGTLLPQWFRIPIIGERFYIGQFSTSPVQEIISGDTFKTYSSIYKWEIIE